MKPTENDSLTSNLSDDLTPSHTTASTKAKTSKTAKPTGKPSKAKLNKDGSPRKPRSDKGSKKPPGQKRSTRSDKGKPRIISKDANKPTAKQRKIISTAIANPNLATREIGKIAGASHVYVCQVLKEYAIDFKATDDFKKYRADIFAGLQGQLLRNITPEEIKKASLSQRVVAAGILFDKERLERGESTANVSTIHSDVALLKGMQTPSEAPK